MSAFDVAAILLALAALFGYLNHKTLRLPSAIGLTVIALIASLCVIGIDRLSTVWHPGGLVAGFVGEIDFSEALLHGMLSFLLFAGALHVELNGLLERRWAITALATVGLLISTAIVGGIAYLLFAGLGLDIPLLHCLIFGALISPTDPVAVIGILKKARVSPSLEAKVAGESLFNDGLGVVVFTVLLALAGLGSHQPSGPLDVVVLFAREALGGAALGFAIGAVAYLALKSIDEYRLEVLITVALVMFLYSLAIWLHTSGPIAVVVAGLLIGNRGRRFAMSATTTEHVDKFWELIDEILNAVLFLLIGLEVIVLELSGLALIAALLMIPLAVIARGVAVLVPIKALSTFRRFSPGAITILVWGGLRGGISVALALSLPGHEVMPTRDVLIGCTYVVVVFSIIVQGLSIGAVVARVTGPKGSPAAPGTPA